MTPTKKISDLLQEAQRELMEIFREKLSSIVLYGSYARGDCDTGSDIDIFVLIDDEEPDKFHKRILRLSVDLSIAYDVDLSVMVKSAADFRDNAEVLPLYKNIAREGINIYAA